MRRAIPLAILALASVVSPVVIAPATAQAAACTWRAEALPLPTGTSLGVVDGADHAGGYAGTVYRSGSGRHVVSWRNGTVTDHGTVTPSTTIRVVDQNRAGTILANTAYGQWGQIKRAFLVRAGQWTELAPVPGATQTVATAVNDAGDVLGTNYVNRASGTGQVVVRWPANQPAAPVELAGVPLHADAIGLDTDGTALVGVRAQAGAHAWPHLWRAGVLTKLAAPPNTREPTGTDIANGRVTGGARTNGPSKGVYWDHDRVPRVLAGSTEGLHINRDGMIVGSATHPDISHSVFRLGTFEHEFGTFDDHVYVGTISDDGTFAGSAVIAGTSSAAVWRCG